VRIKWLPSLHDPGAVRLGRIGHALPDQAIAGRPRPV